MGDFIAHATHAHALQDAQNPHAHARMERNDSPRLYDDGKEARSRTTRTPCRSRKHSRVGQFSDSLVKQRLPGRAERDASSGMARRCDGQTRDGQQTLRDATVSVRGAFSVRHPCRRSDTPVEIARRQPLAASSPRVSSERPRASEPADARGSRLQKAGRSVISPDPDRWLSG